jgi:S-adenosylmethionine:tRNA ribosyltransferase-isomerase
VRAATWPREQPSDERLLHLDLRTGALRDGRVADLPSLLRAGDLLVVNDAATLPASLCARTAGGTALEVRLAGMASDGGFRAVLFGAGDWRTPTEHRPPPARVEPGARIEFSETLHAVVEPIAGASDRLVELRFDLDGDALWEALYRYGRPVQYAYTDGPLALYHVQTAYAARPWAAEEPSAGRPFSFALLLALRQRGVEIAWLTHAAGLSSTGDAALDAALPLPERYEIPDATVAAIAQTRAAGGRVIAVGTSVARALEGAAARNGGALRPGGGETDLLLGPGFRRRVVDGLYTGLHDASGSHFALLQAFAEREVLDRAYAHAEAGGYLCHEFGDSNLIV